MEDENGVIAPEAVEEELDEITEDVIEDVEEESVEELKARLAKAEEIADNQRKRAEKAEKAKKEASIPQSQGGFSTSDAMALINEKVHEDDIERVERYAKAEGLTLREALKTSELKAILGVRSEERQTAATANISSVRRGNSRPSAEAILSGAKSGNMPEDADSIAALMAAKARE